MARRGRLTATDLLGEVLEERGGALDVAEFEDGLEQLWVWVSECGIERRGWMHVRSGLSRLSTAPCWRLGIVLMLR